MVFGVEIPREACVCNLRIMNDITTGLSTIRRGNLDSISLC
jgi:hypothetical protein